MIFGLTFESFSEFLCSSACSSSADGYFQVFYLLLINAQSSVLFSLWDRSLPSLLGVSPCVAVVHGSVIVVLLFSVCPRQSFFP